MLLSKISTSACLSFSLLLCFSFTVKDALQEAVSRDRYISWSNIRKAAAIQIPMDGVPFMACGQQTLVCQFGAERSHDKKETTVKEEPSKPPTEHQYSEALQSKGAVVKLQGEHSAWHQ